MRNYLKSPVGVGSPLGVACTGVYSFGFNGKEKNDETYGDGNAYDFGARIYDTRLGRWLSVDPLFSKYPELSSYNFGTNNPIFFIDFDGEDIIPTTKFLNSGMGKTHSSLIKSNSVYQKMLKAYMSSNKINLGLDINDKKVKPGKEAITKYTWTSSQGKLTGVETQMDFTNKISNRLNDLGNATFLMHEAIHALLPTTQKGEGKSDHENWGKYLKMMEEGIAEYSKDNNLGLDEIQIKELALYNVGSNANPQKSYLEELARQNFTSLEEETVAFNKRMSELTEKKENPKSDEKLKTD